MFAEVSYVNHVLCHQDELYRLVRESTHDLDQLPAVVATREDMEARQRFKLNIDTHRESRCCAHAVVSVLPFLDFFMYVRIRVSSNI